VREAQFDWLGVFGYSDEEGAKRLTWTRKAFHERSRAAAQKLMSMQKQISKRKRSALVGQQFDLLLEGPSEETDLLMEGRTAMHARDRRQSLRERLSSETTPQKASFIAARSPKRTIMIWWRRSLM
jgi:tRNA A37 methylthiotransferase MiaB